jgi:intracellular multiplication protein IcmT
MSTAIEDTEVERQNWHWRNSMRPVRFFNLDARAGIPFIFLLVYFRPITIVLTILVTVFFYMLERRGLTFPAALRSIRQWLIGDRRPAYYHYAHRRLKDNG